MLKSEPFFILSNPRSGSSLLRVICDSHQEITVPPECGFIEWLYSKYHDWEDQDNFTSRLDHFCSELQSTRKFGTWHFDFPLFENFVKEHRPVSFADLAALVHITYGHQKTKKIKVWGDKNNYYIHKTKLIHRLYPKSKFLFIVRDGRDVATSYIALKNLETNSPFAPQLPSKIEDIAEEWNNNNLMVFSFLSNLREEDFYLLKYEDLITNFKETCEAICRFLKVNFDPTMLQYYKLELEPKETLDWKRKTLKSPDKLAIGKYKKELEKDQITRFNSVAEESLVRFGYEL